MATTLARPSFGAYLNHLRTASPAAQAEAGGLLTRAKLAVRAEVSVQYVIALEQGGKDSPTSKMVDRLADALEINPVQRRHLHDLAAYHPPGEVTRPKPPTEVQIPKLDRLKADSLHPTLCGYVDEIWNVHYCNDEYERIFKGIRGSGNVLKWFFDVDLSREIMVEWETEAALTVAWFRALMARRPDNSMFDDYLQYLSDFPEFADMWNDQEIFMGRQSPTMLVNDLDRDEQITLLAEVYPTPDPTQLVQMYLGIPIERQARQRQQG